MLELTAEQLQENWDKLIQLIEDTFEGERKEKLLKMYEHFKDRMMFAPASGQEHFHLCTPGGYVQHILNIVHYSKEFHKIWKENGASVDDYTMEELIFAALHHDLGKVGDLEQDHYIPNPSEWHRKNQGKIYTNNPDLLFMTPPDRGIYILNQFGIKISAIEMLGIKLTDGMYDEGNIQYLKTYAPEKKLKSNMPHILHQADMTTTRIEYEQWVRGDADLIQNEVFKPKEKETKKELEKPKASSTAKDLFDELFGETK
jgi:hypothetical protein